MSGLVDILDLDSVRVGVPATSKKMLFQQLAGLAAASVGGDAAAILNCLNKREKNGSTGYGAGVAIPHCRHPDLERVRGFFVRTAEPIDYAAVDEVPVDLVFMLLSPDDAGVAHLKALAAVSRMLRDEGMAGMLRGARTSDAVFALLTGDEARDAA
ncbi:MAG TPA: PTS sugar transporter subunit IIA [Sphingomonadaceae bacterium]|nr:PTS sugar transporter subunit IIA [Sphingomonadaceae bacterium]